MPADGWPGAFLTCGDKPKTASPPAHVFERPIVTKTGTMKAAFFPAEAYHQDYATLHPYQPYIAFNDSPKVENLKALFRRCGTTSRCRWRRRRSSG